MNNPSENVTNFVSDSHIYSCIEPISGIIFFSSIFKWILISSIIFFSFQVGIVFIIKVLFSVSPENIIFHSLQVYFP